MKLTKPLLWTQVMLLATLMTGCCRSGPEVWDDTRTAGRYMDRGVRSLGGKNGHSRMVNGRDEFCGGYYDDPCCMEGGVAPEDFFAMSDVNYPQARELPGDPGSSVPGVEAFSDPSLHPELAAVFQNVTFDLDSPLVKGENNLQIVHNIANFMRSHPNTYIFIEGHCCEKGPEAYNLALGTRRSNTVRNMLIDEGVDPDHMFTISYGKERPLVMERHDEALEQNRRAEFKIYQR